MYHFLFLLLCVLAALSLAGWVYLYGFRGNFWLAKPRIEDMETPPVQGQNNYPSVVAIVPARDEADVIGTSLRTLLAQDYPGDFRVILVDDGSTDGTAEVARQTAKSMNAESRLEILRGAELPPGWTGKLWAMDQGVKRTQASSPDFIWFTDADISHDVSELGQLVGIAQGQSRDLVSLMVLLHCESEREKTLIPAFVFFFQMLYPFSWVNDPKRKTAAAAGGSMLARRSALAAAGGIEAIKGEVIDDCALARLIKQRGSIWIGLTAKTRSLRQYDKGNDIGDMVARSAYAQLGYSPFLLILTIIGMLIVFAAPLPVAAIIMLSPDLAMEPRSAFSSSQVNAAPWFLAIFLAVAPYGISLEAYRPTLALYGLGWRAGAWWSIVALKYCAMIIESARRHGRGEGGAWKGRTYSELAELQLTDALEVKRADKGTVERRR